MPQLNSTVAPLGTAVLNFEVKSGRITAEVMAEIEGISMPKMGQSDLLDVS